jgi:hypothetical protein
MYVYKTIIAYENAGKEHKVPGMKKILIDFASNI